MARKPLLATQTSAGAPESTPQGMPPIVKIPDVLAGQYESREGREQRDDRPTMSVLREPAYENQLAGYALRSDEQKAGRALA